MKVGDLVYYAEQRMVEIEFIGVIMGGPIEDPKLGTSWKVWWTNQHNNDGSAKMGWWSDWQLRLFNESG